MSIWCYSDQLSFQASDEVTFFISSTNQSVSLEISRWGAELVRVYERHYLHAHLFPIPENASTHGCGWPPAFSFIIPAKWESGYYQVIVRNGDGDVCDHFFVVHAPQPGRKNKILMLNRSPTTSLADLANEFTECWNIIL